MKPNIIFFDRVKALKTSAIALFLLLGVQIVNGQTTIVKLGDNFSLDLGGWVRTEFIYDTRATQEGVDGLFSLFPLDNKFDINGEDINAAPSVAMSAVTTRYTTTFRGPNLGNAETEAYVEMDFTAKSNTNSFMFRQGYMKLKWPKSQLLIGRAWHPLAAYSMPSTVNISLGAPFFVFNRSEQIRYTYQPNRFAMSITASYQNQYASYGPAGRSLEYARHAIVPELSLMTEWVDEVFTLGVVGNMKTLQPRTVVSALSAVDRVTKERLVSLSAIAFVEYKDPFLSLKLNGGYLQNMPEASVMGGYGVSRYDPNTGFETYTPSQTLNLWTNLLMGKNALKYGLFAGYSKNLGTINPIVANGYGNDNYWGLGKNIASMFRIAPKIDYRISRFEIACELEFSSAKYGIVDNADFAKVKDTHSVNNFRTIVMAMYHF